MTNRKPCVTKIQKADSMYSKMTSVPLSIAEVLKIEKGDSAMWIPIPIRLGEEFEKLIVFTTTDNQLNAQKRIDEILNLFKD